MTKEHACVGACLYVRAYVYNNVLIDFVYLKYKVMK